MFLKTKTMLRAFLFALTAVFFLQCSKDVAEEVEEQIINVEEEEEKKDTIPVVVPKYDPDKIISINTGEVVGELYNFWSTRPMINLERFNATGFRNSVEGLKDYVKSYNIVRTMGGRLDNKNNYYKGVDESGKIITDFRGLISSLRNFNRTGLKPRIVLDNVPWEMSGDVRQEDTYGNSRPPLDYGIWRQYVNAFAQALVDEFGMQEVKTWRFRVGTEPNLSPGHWRGTKDQYFKHYDFTVDELTKVIPDAIVGPGNSLTEGVATFTTEIIDHCAVGRNFATGEIGTRMSFFALSYYEKIDLNTIKFPGVVSSYRTKLDSYSQFRNIPFDIQEFGMLRDENRERGFSLSDGTDLGASWYATIADMAYESRLSEIYDWGQEIESSTLPAGRKNVMYMLQKIEDGNRLRASKPKNVNNRTSFAGAIPVVKEGNIYLLVYNHNTSRKVTSSREFFPQLEGSLINGTTSWKMNEWTVDKSNGVFMHELYKDLRAAGVGEKSNGRIYGNRPSDRFEDGWKNVLNSNLDKYEKMSQLPQTLTDSIVTKEDGKLTLKVNLKSHAVKLIELIPQ